MADRWVKWFEGPLTKLKDNPDFGFVVLVYTSAVLERAGRIEKKLTPTDRFVHESPFFDFLKEVIPDLNEPDGHPDAAKNFWGVVRNGLAHDLAVSKLEYQGKPLTTLTIKHDLTCVCRYNHSTLEIAPSKYADAVLSYVETKLGVERFVAGNPKEGVLPLATITPVLSLDKHEGSTVAHELTSTLRPMKS